jgi:hypothetical protein
MDDPLKVYVVPQEVLASSRELLAEPGKEGLEAAILWLGTERRGGDVEILAAHMPQQVAYRSRQGVAVSVVEDALSALIAALPDGVFVPVRLHTHPGRAYHSSTDDANMLLSHRGAISIVVPEFARCPIELPRCSVNELDRNHRWRELGVAEVEERFVVR